LSAFSLSLLKIFRISFITFTGLFLLSSCASTVNSTSDYQSVTIDNRTRKEIVNDLTIIVKNYGYHLFSETETEAVFETQPDQGSIITYAQYDKDYRWNYYSGYRNRNIKLPHYQILFNFTQVNSSILVESKVDYKSWQHKDDQNQNAKEGVEVQKILNELKYNSQVDSNNTRYKKYQTVNQLLKYKIATHKIGNYKKKNYVRKIVLSTVDFNRQVKALLFVRDQLKNYCNYNSGIFEEQNDNLYYSSNGIVIPNIYYNGFNRANELKAFGIKSCESEEGTQWRLVIKPKIIDLKKEISDDKKGKKLTKFKNPEMYIYIFMLDNNLPTFMKKAG